MIGICASAQDEKQVIFVLFCYHAEQVKWSYLALLAKSRSRDKTNKET